MKFTIKTGPGDDKRFSPLFAGEKNFASPNAFILVHIAGEFQSPLRWGEKFRGEYTGNHGEYDKSFQSPLRWGEKFRDYRELG